MKNRLRILKGNRALTSELWLSLFSGNPTARFTQSPFWARLGMEELGWKPVCAVLSDDKVILPGVVTSERFGRTVRMESMPWGMAGGPLGDPASGTGMNDRIRRALTRVAPEIIMYPSRRMALPGWDEIHHVIHEVEIPSRDPGNWGFAHRKCRTAARHALKKGITVEAIHAESDIRRVIRLHQAQQRLRNARTYPETWWKRIVTDAISNAGLWGAFHEGRIIAALLMVWRNDHGIALVSTSDPVSRPLNAGNLLYLRVFEILGNNGIRTVDLGGSRGIRSLEFFKESLGGNPRIRWWYRHRLPAYRLYRTITAFVRARAGIDMSL